MAFLTKFAKAATVFRPNSFVTSAVFIRNNRTISDEVDSKLQAYFKKQEDDQLVVPIFKKSLLIPERVAIRDSNGTYTHLRIYKAAKKLSTQISNICGSGTLSSVVYLYANNVFAPVAIWACWMSGQVVLPIHCGYPYEQLKELIGHVKPMAIISTNQHEPMLEKLATDMDIAMIMLNHNFLLAKDIMLLGREKMVLATDKSVFIEGSLNEDFYTQSNGMFLYTAGTTGGPKGVTLSHANIDAQAKHCANLWNLSMSDHVLHVNLESHMSVCICALMSVLRSGGRVIMQDQFCSAAVWAMLLGVTAVENEKVSIFIADPSTYSLLIKEFDKTFAKLPKVVDFIKNYMKDHIRHMISFSAPVSPAVAQRWLEITGHSLIEVYGMTEIGLILQTRSIPTEPVHQANISKTTEELPCDVLVRLVNNENKVLMTEDAGDEVKAAADKMTTGELEVAGPTVFEKYINVEGDKHFQSGYFKTGDVFTYGNGALKFQGRLANDIINTGVHSVSCSEIESLLVKHPSIQKVVVIGIPDPIGGERICAICELHMNTQLDLKALHEYCSNVLPTHKHPSLLKIVPGLPANINKKALAEKVIRSEL